MTVGLETVADARNVGCLKYDGITVRQTVAHTIQLWPRGLGTPRGSHLSKRKEQ